MKEVRRASIPKVEPYVEISPKRELYFSNNINNSSNNINNSCNNNTNGTGNNNTNGTGNTNGNSCVSNRSEHYKDVELDQELISDDNPSRYFERNNIKQGTILCQVLADWLALKNVKKTRLNFIQYLLLFSFRIGQLLARTNFIQYVCHQFLKYSMLK